MKVSIRYFESAQPTSVSRRDWVQEFQCRLGLSCCFFIFDMYHETETSQDGRWHCMPAAIVSPGWSDVVAGWRWVTGRRESWGESTAVR